MTRGEDAGFTVVELMAAVLIIGILATIAIASFVSSTAIAEQVSCKANRHTLTEAATKYALVTGERPDEMRDLETWVRSYPTASRCPTDGRMLVYDADTGVVSCTHPDHR